MTLARHPILRPILRLAAGLLPFVAAIAVACDDPLARRADTENSIQIFTVYALSGTPPNAPAAISLSGRSITRVTGALDFDIAFDLDTQGRIVLLPVGLVGASPVGSKAIGMQKVSGSFTDFTEAPRSGYVFDSTLVVARGQVVAIQAQENFCSLSLTPYIFAKIVIDSVDTANRALIGHTLINLNCGFRQLTPGLPGF